ncbi:hypothetical protein ACFORJ_00720 [Corynebacterium hansenii]|uniref:Uncharacterized protein n=1 Tax=Corynebacterium hansenii TaxID=394964 RepID=A0ABV7ZJG3_9CORY|nr:hypothetical protein [Corynebacterium hansenii]WJY99476.1 hypothetical protein CHAN_04265 [Corynebacterium hansenii]
MNGPGEGGEVTVEKHWGDPDRSQVREDIGRGEMITGIAWLSVASLVSLVLEVVYLGMRVDVAGASIPVPWTIAAAYLFNLIITRTAMLWTKNRAIALVPMWAWIAGFVALFIWTGLPFGGDKVLGESIRTILLLIAGIVGGGWPLRHLK